MALVEINWSPSDRQLRQFGAVAMLALPLVGWLWGADLPVIGGLAASGVVLAATGFFVPKVLKPVFWLLTMVAAPIGMVVGEVALLVIFVVAFIPIGLWFRLTKRDPLQMECDPNATTYWQKKKRPQNAASYYRQF